MNVIEHAELLVEDAEQEYLLQLLEWETRATTHECKCPHCQAEIERVREAVEDEYDRQHGIGVSQAQLDKEQYEQF